MGNYADTPAMIQVFKLDGDCDDVPFSARYSDLVSACFVARS